MTISQGEGTIGGRATRELARMAAVFTAGEAEIARAYFDGENRSKETDILFLTSQAGREYSSGLHILQSILERREGDLSSLERNWLSDSLFKAQQELNHGDLCAEILEWLTGWPADMKELFRYDLFDGDPTAPNNREQSKLSHLFQEQEQRTEPWAGLVQHNSGYGLLEGGGCGMFYSASLISGSEVNERIAKAFQIVLEDERDHGPPNIMRVESFIATEEQLKEVKELLRVRGSQRLRYRNEQFSYPLTEERIAELAEGNVDLGMVAEVWGPVVSRYLE